MQGSLEVTDLFKGAFLLCMGARVDRVRVRNNGRAIATFLITGRDLDRLDSTGSLDGKPSRSYYIAVG